MQKKIQKVMQDLTSIRLYISVQTKRNHKISVNLKAYLETVEKDINAIVHEYLKNHGV